MIAGAITRIEDHPFFADWTGPDLIKLGNASKAFHYEKDDIIVDIGSEKYGCYFILNGEVSILMPIDGRLTEVDSRRAGEIFGEIAMLTNEPFFARVVARSSCDIGFMSRESINEFIGKIPPVLSKLLRSLVGHLGRSSVGLVERSIHQEKMAIVGSVAHDVVSDFQSPTQMISLGVEAISQLSRDKQVKSICSSITDQVTKIMELASELAVFARSEAELRFTHVNLREFMERFHQNNQDIFKNPDLKIVIDVPDIDVDMEPLSMMKAFHNLLINAVFTMFENRGHIWISARILDDRNLEISFKDDGKGIPESIRKNYWEPFMTTETGLCMSVVKGVVESHGGVINFDSEVGVGTNFIIVLPRFHVTAS